MTRVPTKVRKEAVTDIRMGLARDTSCSESSSLRALDKHEGMGRPNVFDLDRRRQHMKHGVSSARAGPSLLVRAAARALVVVPTIFGW